MNTKEQILTMVKEGSISIDEGLELINAIESKESVKEPQRKTLNKRLIRIVVDSKDGEKVRVNIPLSLAKIGLDLGSQLNIDGQKLNLQGIDLDKILDQIDEDTHGELLTVDSEKGDHVRIFID